MGTKNNPGAFDCYRNALPDEPFFVLLARDPQAPTLVRHWAQLRSVQINQGRQPNTDSELVREALELACSMEQWRGANDGRWRTEKAPPSINADLLAACKAQHEAIDRLFALLIKRSVSDDLFFPSRSGQPWDAFVAGNAAIAKAEAM